MAYEALCRIKWKLFQSWARERSSLQDLDDEVKLLHDLFADKHNGTVDIEISEQVLQLLHTLKKSVITNGLWIQFNVIFSEDQNYSYWSKYIELVEIMLDFIRAYRIGEWKLHLQTFAKTVTLVYHIRSLKLCLVGSNILCRHAQLRTDWSISRICGRQFCC